VTPGLRPLRGLQTARLQLTSLDPETVEAMIARDGAQVAALTGATLPEPFRLPPLLEDALPVVLKKLREHPADWTWSIWLIAERPSGSAVGTVGFAPGGEDGTVQVGYAVYPEVEGRGFATEALRAAVSWAFAHEGTRVVQAAIPPWNAPSIRVAEKVGMRFTGTGHDDEVGEVLLYAVDVRAPEGA
jgi:RimJ/RimL family protein N-acetyltransferase